MTKSVNPFRDDPNSRYLFDKWGEPINVERTGDGLFQYRCALCSAEWIGPNGDHCEWCHKRWRQQYADKRTGLLLPDWLLWDQSYFNLPKQSQRVWEETRGYSQYFVEAWFTRLKKAVTNGDISENEADAAGKRVAVWIKRMP